MKDPDKLILTSKALAQWKIVSAKKEAGIKVILSADLLPLPDMYMEHFTFDNIILCTFIIHVAKKGQEGSLALMQLLENIRKRLNVCDV